MLVGGFDFDTHAVHLVLIDLDGERPPWYHPFPLSGADAFDRVRDVARIMPYRSSILWDECLAFGIEEPQGRHKATVAKLKAVQGAILACLPERTLVHPLMPAEWRRLAGLPGNASKGDVEKRSRALSLDMTENRDYRRDVITLTFTGPHDLEDWTQDAHDAHLIARATASLLDHQEAA